VKNILTSKSSWAMQF